jgi:glycosyltransferase involved in cell wall biosynthesis
VKVLHVIPSIGLAHGGPSVVVRTMARSQAESGLEVHVATTDDDGPDRLKAPADMPFVEQNVKYWVFRRQTRFYKFSLPMTLWLWKHARDYDIVHIHALFSYSSVAAAFCAKLANIPYIVRPLGTLNRWGMRNRRPWLKRLSFWLFESRVLKCAAGVHYTSEQEAHEAGQLSVEHVSLVVPNPVELPDAQMSSGSFREAHPELATKTIILLLSRLDIKKGIDLLLPAFARLRLSRPDTVLVLAGNGDPTFVEALKDQATRLGLADGVLWPGFLRGEMKQGALEAADIFVLPSYSENFGVAVVEAMGTGLPVIVSDQIGIHDQIAAAEAGIVVECSIGQLESALGKLLDDASLRARMGRNARLFAQQFAPREVARQLASAYAHIRSNHVQRVAA